jgi:hypothetical protein
MLKDKEHAEYMEFWETRASRTLEFLRGIVDLTPYDCRAPLATASVDGVSWPRFLSGAERTPAQPRHHRER